MSLEFKSLIAFHPLFVGRQQTITSVVRMTVIWRNLLRSASAQIYVNILQTTGRVVLMSLSLTEPHTLMLPLRTLLDTASVEVLKAPLSGSLNPQKSEVVQTLPELFNLNIGVAALCQVLCDMHLGVIEHCPPGLLISACTNICLIILILFFF